MPSTIKETVTIQELGKWGPRIDGTYYSFGKFLKDKAPVVPGAVLDIETYVSDSGKKSINKILRVVDIKPVTIEAGNVDMRTGRAVTTKTAVTGPTLPAYNGVFKARDFDAEARGKSKFGFFAAALQSPAMAALADPADMIALAIKMSDAGMDYVFGESK